MSLDHNDLPVFYGEFVDIWKEINQKMGDGDLSSKYAETSKLLGQYAALNNQTISIYNTKTQDVLYMSENYLSMTGYTCTEAEYKRWSTAYWMRDLHLAQSWFFIQMTLFFKTTLQPKIKNSTGQKSLDFCVHNLMLKPPGGKKYHFSLIVHTLELASNASPLIFLTIKKDIEGLIKDNAVWWAEFNINGTEKFCFHQNEKKFIKGSLLTAREIEILNLVRQGQDSKQIANTLFISPHTVDTHRKNMLERIGAKDFSSLIQICEMAKIL